MYVGVEIKGCYFHWRQAIFRKVSGKFLQLFSTNFKLMFWFLSCVLTLFSSIDPENQDTRCSTSVQHKSSVSIWCQETLCPRLCPSWLCCRTIHNCITLVPGIANLLIVFSSSYVQYSDHTLRIFFLFC